MQLVLIAVGRLKGPMEDAAKGYEKRIRGLTVTELKEERLAQNPSDAQIQAALVKEAERILAKIPAQAYVVLLDKEGGMTSSEGFSGHVEQWRQKGGPLVFVIGSSHGVADALRQRADRKLSFSKMTFPHQLMRVLFLEQLYRAQTIRDGQTYHK